MRRTQQLLHHLLQASGSLQLLHHLLHLLLQLLASHSFFTTHLVNLLLQLLQLQLFRLTPP